MFRLMIKLGREGRKVSDAPIEDIEAMSFVANREQAHRELDRLLDAMEIK